MLKGRISLKLTDRLLTIAKCVTPNSKVADIGTDHGYIPVYLLKNKITEYVIAADINKGPLENAKKEVDTNKLSEFIELRLGGGMTVLKEDEVDEVIIAGMGGVLISEIIDASIEIAKKLKKLILQPMQASDELRKYLYNNNFAIIEEKLVKEDFRIYEILIVEYNPKEKVVVEEIFYEVGKKLVENNDILLKEFLKKKINEYEKILSKIEKLISLEVEIKKSETITKLCKLKELERNCI